VIITIQNQINLWKILDVSNCLRVHVKQKQQEKRILNY